MYIVVQSLSCVRLSATPWTAARWASLSFTISWSLLMLTSLSQWYHPTILFFCCPLLLPSVFLSIRVFSSELALRIRWPKFWRFSFNSVIPMNCRGWFHLGLTGLILLSKELSKSLLQHHSLKTSILWRSAFFMIQLSYPYMTTWKTIPLTIWTFVGKMMSLLFNTLSRFVIAFLPKSKLLLISWLQSPSNWFWSSRK